MMLAEKKSKLHQATKGIYGTKKSKNPCSNIIVIIGNFIEHLLHVWHCSSTLQEWTHLFFTAPIWSI